VDTKKINDNYVSILHNGRQNTKQMTQLFPAESFSALKMNLYFYQHKHMF